MDSRPLSPVASAGDELLGEDDRFNIIQELGPVAHRWRSIGLALGLRENTLEKIKSQGHDDVVEMLTNVIVEWLKGNYNTNKFGQPTWHKIVEAVKVPAGGRDPHLADEIARKYCGAEVVVTQPVSKPTPTPTPSHVNSSSVASPEVQGGFCCCSLSGTSSNQKGQVRSRRSFSLPRRGHGSGEYDNFTRSLPSRVTQYNESSLHIKTLEETADIVGGAPTWQIREIAQLTGYWGVLKGKAAEHYLKRHRSNNCYLIRYSEEKKHFVISVLTRDAQRMLPVAYHFKLNVTKEDDHNVYEIDGTEEKFTEISSLLEFYQKITISHYNCTLGRVCPKPVHFATF